MGKTLIAICLAILASGISLASDQQSPLSDDERQLADLINQLRQENGISPVPVTNSLTEVARAHISDLNLHHPDTETYGTGECNRHSWSGNGEWKAVCYTGSAQASLMWSKPREITESYSGNGYEIACWNSQKATPSIAMNEWKSSSDHSDTILQKGIFAGCSWRAMGVGIDGNYASVWFGEDEDPAGPVPGAVLEATNSPDSGSAYAGMTLTARNTEYSPGEAVQFVLKKTTPGSANLEGARYEIEKEVNGEWKRYFKVGAQDWHFKAPVIKYGDEPKIFEWDGRQKDDPQNKVTRGKYRIKFYAPKAFEGFMTAKFRIG